MKQDTGSWRGEGGWSVPACVSHSPVMVVERERTTTRGRRQWWKAMGVATRSIGQSMHRHDTRE